MTWIDARPDAPPLGLSGWTLAILRALVLGVVVFGGLGLLLLVRLVERPLCGAHRPVTPFITQSVCRAAFPILGIRYRLEGRPMRQAGAIVANHSGWLDIFALNAAQRIYFVSKSEVARWPGIGWLARATGTVFIRRDPRETLVQIAVFRERLALGHRLLFFPEGTSTDGRRVLAFKPTLFAAFFDDGLRETMLIQPVSVIYQAGAGADPRQYGWWGDMAFGPHLLATLSARRQGSVTVIHHPAIRVADVANRKALARALEETVRSGLAQAGVLDDQPIAARNAASAATGSS
ncbi:MAG: 1-acyl-sn-glycerol-3-phosphate acyltransferase [Limimaricola sp.]|uniref:lysophospholipid acyltransferase family protein n=1 Tax=Limimaricola sp. TaxID=2211665 RepID=UPI001D56E692|nr:lysophospholipid acyltransferase family protein [Limimaricola sp.]MBI1417991.1 1-acyl-sn-glycerol-3-phosphate acyltransferase [Limimaricola sp.]